MNRVKPLCLLFLIQLAWSVYPDDSSSLGHEYTLGKLPTSRMNGNILTFDDGFLSKIYYEQAGQNAAVFRHYEIHSNTPAETSQSPSHSPFSTGEY